MDGAQWSLAHAPQRANTNRRLTEYGTSFARGTSLKDKWPRCHRARQGRREFITLLGGAAVAWPPRRLAIVPWLLVFVIIGRLNVQAEALLVGLGFSDDRRLFFLVLILFVFFFLVIIIVGVARRQHADDSDEAPVNQPGRNAFGRSHVGLSFTDRY